MVRVLLVSTKIRMNNSNNVTYVLKRYSDNTGIINTFVKNNSTNCYSQTGSKRIKCNKKNTFIFYGA